MLVISRAKWLVFLWLQHQLASGSANYFKLMQSCWPGEGRWASLKQPQQTLHQEGLLKYTKGLGH